MTIIPTILIIAAISLITSAIIAGIVSFSATRAVKAKQHETATPVIEYVPLPGARQVILSDQRLDRHTYYLGVLIALWFAGVGVMISPIGTGALATLAESTQKLLAFALILGTSLSLLGSSLGPPRTRRRWNPIRWWFPSFKEGHAYGIGAGGQIAIGVALAYFGWAVVINGSLIGTITGLLTPLLSISAFRLGRQLWTEHRRLDAEWWGLRRAATGEDDR